MNPKLALTCLYIIMTVRWLVVVTMFIPMFSLIIVSALFSFKLALKINNIADWYMDDVGLVKADIKDFKGRL